MLSSIHLLFVPFFDLLLVRFFTAVRAGNLAAVVEQLRNQRSGVRSEFVNSVDKKGQPPLIAAVNAVGNMLGRLNHMFSRF